MRWVALACLLAPFAAPLPALAQDAVGNVGTRSPDVPTADLAPIDAALDRAVVVNAAVAKGRQATLAALAADPEIASQRALAVKAADAGAADLRALEVDKAQAEFDKAVALFVTSHGDRLDPGDVARLHTTRAKIALMKRDDVQIHDEFSKAVPVHPTKSLDPVSFPPDAQSLFKKVVSEEAAKPLAAAGGAQLADIARRAGVKWVVSGEVRNNAQWGGYVVGLTVSDAAGQTHFGIVNVPDILQVGSVLESALQKLFLDAGIPAASAATNLARLETPTPTPFELVDPTPRPVPTQALPRRDGRVPGTGTTGGGDTKKWMLVGSGAAALIVAGLIIGTAGQKSGGGTSQPGITLVIQK